MKKDKIREIVTFLIENDVKAQDIYFDWEGIFEAMVIIEDGRNGLLDNKCGYKHEAWRV